MTYNYENEKDAACGQANQVMFLQIRDAAKRLIDRGGCAMMGSIVAGCTGDSWTMLACVDRLVELGELVELKYGKCAAQHRVFSRKNV